MFKIHRSNYVAKLKHYHDSSTPVWIAANEPGEKDTVFIKGTITGPSTLRDAGQVQIQMPDRVRTVRLENMVSIAFQDTDGTRKRAPMFSEAEIKIMSDALKIAATDSYEAAVSFFREKVAGIEITPRHEVAHLFLNFKPCHTPARFERTLKQFFLITPSEQRL